MEWSKDKFIVSDDSELLEIDAIHAFLEDSYWAKGRSRETIEKSIRNSFSLGMYHNGNQMGFARAVTDYATQAYLCDVYIAEEYRNRKLGHFLLECLFSHPKVKGLKWLLKTSYSQSLYRDFGFKPVESNSGWMVKGAVPS